MENKRHKVLLVEDDKLDQKAFKKMVEEQELSYDCTIAGSVSEAKKVLKDKLFDAVISDYSLGDGTAFDVLDSVKNAPVIFITGAGDEEIAVKAWRAGAYDYVVKDHERHYLKTLPITLENTIKHKWMEKRLHLLSHALVSTNDSVYINDLQNKITFVNRAFCETYGYSEEEIIGQDCNILWQNKPVNGKLRENYAAIDGWEVGFFHKRKDGSEFPVSLSKSEIIDENGNKIAVVVVARDISERMEIENELRYTSKQLRKQNQQNKAILIEVCHRLLTPIKELKKAIDTMQSDPISSKSSQLQDNLKLAEENVKGIKKVVDNFLSISESDYTCTNEKFDELCVRVAMSHVLNALATIASEMGVKSSEIITDSELALKADWDRIIQVLKDFSDSATKVAIP